MTTAAQRLVQLSGLAGVTAAAHLRSLALAGGLAGALLVGYSGLPTGTAAQHLLAEHTASNPVTQTLDVTRDLRLWLAASERSWYATDARGWLVMRDIRDWDVGYGRIWTSLPALRDWAASTYPVTWNIESTSGWST